MRVVPLVRLPVVPVVRKVAVLLFVVCRIFRFFDLLHTILGEADGMHTLRFLITLLGVVCFASHASVVDAGEQFPSTLREVNEREPGAVPSQPASYRKSPVAMPQLAKPQGGHNVPQKPKPSLGVGEYWTAADAGFENRIPPGIASFNSSNIYQKPKPMDPGEFTLPRLPNQNRMQLNRDVSRGTQSIPFDLEANAPIDLDLDDSAASTPQSSLVGAVDQGESPKTESKVTIGATFGDSEPVRLTELSATQRDAPNANPNLKIRMIGPSTVEKNQQVELTVEVANWGDTASLPSQVRLKIPDEFTITRFEQEAWLDEKERTVTFAIKSIPSRFQQTIRLRGVSYQTGRHNIQTELLNGREKVEQSSFAIVVNNSPTLRNASTPSSETERSTKR